MAGRKKVEISWMRVDKALIAGASGVQVAAMLGVHYNTLAAKCKEEKKCDFSEYLRQKREKGNEMLLSKQFEEAMAGDRGMLIWLGKQRLNQSDKRENTHTGNIFNKLQIIEDSGEEEDSTTNDTDE